MPTVRALTLAIGLAVTALLAPLLTAPAASAARAAVPRASVTLNPGDPIYADGGVCVVAAYVTDGASVYILTAGACGKLGDTWYTDQMHSVLAGTTASGGTFPDDYGTLIAPAPGITPVHTFDGTGDAFVGESVCMLAGGGTSCGTVQGLNATIWLDDGTVLSNLIVTTICSGPGTPILGAPLFAGGTLLGIQPLANADCTSGGQSFFQQINDVLAVFGVTLY